MATLHLIRHGKATPGAATYDQLHTLGTQQSQLLGEHLQKRRVHFDAIYCGPLVRQRATLAVMREGAGDVGSAWPEESIVPELAEAPLEAIARHCFTERLPNDP